MPRRTFSNEQWREIIQTCRKSGLSDHHWCKDNGIAASTFYKYSKKLREDICIPSPSFGARVIPEIQEVVQVDMDMVSKTSTGIEHNASRSVESPAISLHINGIRMDIHNYADEVILTKTLKALKSIC